MPSYPSPSEVSEADLTLATRLMCKTVFYFALHTSGLTYEISVEADVIAEPCTALSSDLIRKGNLEEDNDS